MNPIVDAGCRAARRRQAELELVCEGCVTRTDYESTKDCANCEVYAEIEETEKAIARYERRAKHSE